MKSFLVLVAFAVVGTANGGAISAATWVPSTYVTGVIPENVKFLATYASEGALTNKIVITPSTTIWAADGLTTCTTDVAATTKLECTAASAILTCEIKTAAITAATATTITCTNNLAANGAVDVVLTASIKHTATGGTDVDASIAIGASPPYKFVAAAAEVAVVTTTPNSTVATTTKATNAAAAAAAAGVGVGAAASSAAVAFLFASFF